MVLITTASRPGGILLLEASKLLASVARGSEGVANICVTSPIDGVALSVNENADPDVRTDHIAAIPRLHPPPGAMQSLLFRKSLTLPYSGGRFTLGTWQGIYLIDLRDKSAKEPVSLTVTCRESTNRIQFTVDATARDATRLGPEIAKRLPTNRDGSKASRGDGAVLVHEMHTSASLCLGDGNIEPVMNEVVPEKWHYDFFQHTMEGVDDMTGHLKCSLLGCSATVPVKAHEPLLPVRLNEHRYGGGWGGGHQRRILCDHLPQTEREPFDFAVDGTTELGPELAKRGGDFMNVVVGEGCGGLLLGSRAAIDGYQAPDAVVLAQTVDWPAEAQLNGAQLWWRGGAATLRITPL